MNINSDQFRHITSKNTHQLSQRLSCATSGGKVQGAI